MRRFFFALLAAVGVISASSAMAFDINTQAPDFTLPAQDGSHVKLSDFANDTVVLEWYNYGCPFVKKHYGSGNMQKLQEKYTGEGVKWLRIVSSAPGKQGHLTVAEAAEDHAKTHATYTLLDEDGAVGRLYGAQTTPHMFVIDHGKLVYRGAIDSIPSPIPADIDHATNYVAAALDAIKAGKPVAVADTEPYGCGVKY